MVAPTLEAVRVRVDVRGIPAVDGLSFATKADRSLVLGGARALFDAASGVRRVAHGEIRVSGARPLLAVRGGEAAAAPLDPVLPMRWTVRAYVTWSSRLSGPTRSRARVLAEQAIEELKIGHVADVLLGKADLIVRRAAVVAAALATDARVLLLEDPTSNLTDEQAQSFSRLIVRALQGRAVVVFAPRLPLASPLAIDAEEALVIVGSDLVAQGAPAEIASRGHELALRIQGDSGDFARAASLRGATVTGTGALLRIDLGETLKARDLLAIAVETHAAILEVRPVAGALA